MKKSSTLRVQAGYFIFEFLMYFALAVFMIMLTLEWAVTHQQQQIVHNAARTCAQEMHTASILLERDVRQAIGKVSTFKQAVHNEYVWQISGKDIGWCIKDGMLLRTQGLYHQKTHSWQHQSTALIAAHIQELYITSTCLPHQRVRINYALHGTDTRKSEGFVYLRNGVVL